MPRSEMYSMPETLRSNRETPLNCHNPARPSANHSRSAKLQCSAATEVPAVAPSPAQACASPVQSGSTPSGFARQFASSNFLFFLRNFSFAPRLFNNADEHILQRKSAFAHTNHVNAARFQLL